MEQQNGKGWDKNFIAPLIGIVISFILGGFALLFTVATPELRKCFGLKEDKPVPQPHVVQPQPLPTPVPTEYTLAEHKRQIAKEANTALSFSFQHVGGVSLVSLIISPVGKSPLTRAMLNGSNTEFTSSTGIFLVTVLDIDWEGKIVTVQVSRKG